MDTGQSKDSFRDELVEKVKVKVSVEVSSLPKMCIMLTCDRVFGMICWCLVVQSPI